MPKMLIEIDTNGQVVVPLGLIKNLEQKVLSADLRIFAAAQAVINNAAVPQPAPIQTAWQPIETAPKSGEFLLGVWEGSWKNPRQRFRVYHASGYSSGPSWAMQGSYRTEEGGAYELAGWQPLPPRPPAPGGSDE